MSLVWRTSSGQSKATSAIVKICQEMGPMRGMNESTGLRILMVIALMISLNASTCMRVALIMLNGLDISVGVTSFLRF